MNRLVELGRSTHAYNKSQNLSVQFQGAGQIFILIQNNLGYLNVTETQDVCGELRFWITEVIFGVIN